MLYSTKTRMIAGFTGVSFLVGTFSLVIGVFLLHEAVDKEVLQRVHHDLAAAQEIQSAAVHRIELAVAMTAESPSFSDDLNGKEVRRLQTHIQKMVRLGQLDFAGVCQPNGLLVSRAGLQTLPAKDIPEGNSIIPISISRRVAVSGAVLVSCDFLSSENPALADRARILNTSGNASGPGPPETTICGMALAAAVPIINGGVVAGVVYGGIVLNNNPLIVDKVHQTLYFHETYHNQDVGKASVFLNDIRIATSAMVSSGKRAVGTRVSGDVRQRVLEEGKRWVGVETVLENRYISAFEAIEDISGKRIGMIAVGVLEDKYTDVVTDALSLFILITVAGMTLAIGLGYVLAHRIMNPIDMLVKASQEVSEGNLSPEIGMMSRGEIGVLQKTFSQMVASLRTRDMERKHENENQLLRTEQQAAIGRFAAGVAHEINNPLTGVLTYTHMLLKRTDLKNDIRSDLQIIVESTERVRKIVKGLLDFSRQTELDREEVDVNRIVGSTLTLIENQALIKGVSIRFNPGEGLPTVRLDRSQARSVLLNIIINAVDATPAGGHINIYTSTGLSAGVEGKNGVEITVADTGSGILPENLEKIFEPFFTTKEVGQGTGLGLAVSFGIIRRHGGTIRVQSEAGKGSRFFIWLPIGSKEEKNDSGR